MVFLVCVVRDVCYHLFSDILFAVKYNINKLPFSRPSSSSFFHTFSQLHPSILHPPVLSGMASMTASAATAVVARASLVPKTAGFSSAHVLGLPQMRIKGGRVTCSSEKTTAAPVGMGAASMLAAVSVMSVSNPVLALVDERMTTEGTGLSLGLSNNLLGWILLGVFGLIWSLYTVYTSTLEEDEESGLSL